MKKAFLLILLTSLNFLATFAQSGSGVEMATGLRSSGKIYVVVLVLLVIFIGFIIYLITIDRRIGKLERKNKKLDN
ncbi:CcmD family protein [Albibacterium indicum]|uniref:CcmD family protein n=1 Tax=Albibacterium indicum TaxID=2292082 RepID=UPI000E4EF5E5|nr:CcmD family protein [Pedobacter indicus]